MFTNGGLFRKKAHRAQKKKNDCQGMLSQIQPVKSEKVIMSSDACNIQQKVRFEIRLSFKQYKAV